MKDQAEKDKKEVEKKPAHQPHDGLFKGSFSYKEVILDFLSSNISPDLFNLIDQESFQLTNKSFIDPVGKRTRSDLIFKSQLKGESGYLYIHLEQESRERNNMVLRFLNYNQRLIDQHLKEHGKKAHIPIIINICIHNGNQAYKGSNKLENLYANPELAKQYKLGNFFLLDLSTKSEEELHKYGKASFAMMLLKQGIYRRFKEWIINHMDLIVNFSKKGYIPYEEEAFRYMLSLDDDKELLEIIEQSDPKIKETIMSIAQRLIQEGRQEGIQIGAEKGRQEGIQIGAEKGRQEGEMNKALSVAKAMIQKGYPIEDIMLLTGLSRSHIQGLV